MAYATVGDVIGRYKPIQSMISTGTLDVTSAEVASIYIADAESIINAYLRVRYVVPLGTEPLLTALTSDIALYRLAEDRSPRIPDLLERRYTNAITVLAQLQVGCMALGSSYLLSVGGNNEVWSSQQSFHSIFSPVLNELEQKVDADWVIQDKDVRIDDC